MMGGEKRIFLFPLFLLTAALALQAERAAVKELGAPYIRNYTPEEYGAGAQNWAVAQDRRGIIYFGNGTGILEFDGRNWTLIQIPKSLDVRSLAIDDQGTIYTGSLGEFGYLAADTRGKTIYVSLVPQLKKEDQLFNDVWKIFATSHGVYFLTLKKIYRLRQNGIEVIPADLVALYGFAINDEVFIIQREQGIYLLKDGRPRLLPFTERFANLKSGYINMLPWRERRPMILDGEGRFFTYDLNAFYDPHQQAYDVSRPAAPRDVLKPFFTEISAYLNINTLYNGIAIPGGRYALATLKGGIVIINSQGKLERVINKNRGLMDNSVANLCLDREQNLWAALNTGMAYIAISSPISRFDAANDLEGYLIAVTRFHDRIFVGSFSGVFVLDDYQLKLAGDNPHFTLLQRGLRECWDFLPFGRFLLSASNPKILRVDSQLQIQAFATKPIYTLGRSPIFSNLIFAGLMDGLGVFTLDSGTERDPQLTLNSDVFKKITDPIRRIIPDGHGNLWLTTSNKGLIHVRFRSRNLNDYELTRYGTSEGLPQLDWNYVHFIDGRLLVGTKKGIYEGLPASPDPQQTLPTRFRPEATFGKSLLDPPQAVVRIMKDNRNRWWIQSDHGIEVVPADAPGDALQLRRDCFNPIPITETEEVAYLDEGSILWVPTTKGLFRFDPAVVKDYQIPYPALIRRVISGKDHVLFQGNHYDPLSRQDDAFPRLSQVQSDSLIPTLAFKENALIFSFSAPFFEYNSALRFQYLLEGFDKSWSDWTAQNMKEFTYLPKGSYAFRVKARNVYGHESSEAVFRFIISPPWYRTWLAYLGFAVIGFGLLAGGVRAYTLKLQREKERLEKIVAERTEEIARKNEELREMSLCDPLTGLRNRRYINEILSNDVSAFVSFKKYMLEAKDRRNFAEQSRMVFGVVMFDIDHFKMVNDTYGHDTGDKFLQHLAQILKASVRVDDAVMRIGGEEFLVVLKKTMPEYLETFTRKIMEKIRQVGFQTAEGVVLKRTCSIGYTIFPFYGQRPEMLNFEQTIMIADLGLYYAKEHGRDMAVKIEPTLSPPIGGEDVKKMVSSLDFGVKMNYFTIKT